MLVNYNLNYNYRMPNKQLKTAHCIRWDNLPLVLLAVGFPLAKRYAHKGLTHE